MNNITALLFPDTVPAVQKIAALLYFFNTVDYYLPTEPVGHDPANPVQQLLHGLCTGYTPAPLGNDLERFNHLIRELETYRSDDLTRLFSFAKTEIATGQIRDRDESSAGTLLTALQKTGESSRSAAFKERLWQARLVLKLAEMLDKKETAVSNGLAALAGLEQKIYGSLHGTDEPAADAQGAFPGFALGKHDKKPTGRQQDMSPSQADLLIPLRLKAWAELFLFDSIKKHPHILVTGHTDAANQLIDGCENIFQKQPARLFSLALPIPANIDEKSGSEEDFVSQRRELQHAGHGSHAAIGRFLMTASGFSGMGPDSITAPAGLEREVEAWNESVHRLFPESSINSNSLDFYCFPAIAVEQLFQRLFHLDDPGMQGKPAYPTAIIGVLHAK